MSPLEIALLIAGALIFLLSFLIPVRQEESGEDIRELVDAEVKKRVEQEVDALRGHVDDVVDEAVEYAQEKTQRSLERITNEKIMAVNEYSDTVLEEINKNHKEVMFLYDMLNDKQEGLQETVESAREAARVMEETTREAARAKEEAAAESAPAQQTGANARAQQSGQTAQQTPQSAGSTAFSGVAHEAGERRIRTLDWAKVAASDASVIGGRRQPSGEPEAPTPAEAPHGIASLAREITAASADPVPAQGGQAGGPEEIPQLELHRRVLAMNDQGMDSVAIARELGMGVGEVDLIIGLHGEKRP